MKKSIPFLLCGCVAFGVASCSKDDEAIEKSKTGEKLVNMSFFTTNDEGSTRTALSSNGTSVVWNAGDVLSVGYEGSEDDGTQPFKASVSGNKVRFFGQAPEKTTPYYAMYPYQATNKITYVLNGLATFSYTLPSTQTAIANTFDPKANPSVALIPKAEDSFKAYNLGGLLKFTLKGSSNVKQVTLLSIGNEPLCGEFKSNVAFRSNGAILRLNQAGTGSSVITYKPESGLFAEQTAYYIALPTTTLQQGLTLALILNNDKVVQYKVRSAVAINRGEIKDLGMITVDESKARSFILKNQGLIEAVSKYVPGLVRNADGNLNLYEADNFQKVLAYKGTLVVNNQDSFTSLDELQYYRNITGLTLLNNKNLAGKLDFSKYPQLVETITVVNSPKVTSINATGLDKLYALTASEMDNLADVTIGGNSKLNTLRLSDNKVLKAIDARNLPELETLNASYNAKLTSVQTSGSPKVKDFNVGESKVLTSLPDLNENREIVTFVASSTKLLESLDFSNQPKLESVNIAYSGIRELKGLAASGTNLKYLQLALSQVASLDVSKNTELLELDLYGAQVSKLDVTTNKKLTKLRLPFNPLVELKIGNNSSLKYLDISHCRLTTFDIRTLPALTEVYAGHQGTAANILQYMTVYYTAAQKTVLDPVIANSSSTAPGKVEFSETNAYATYVVKN